MKEQPVKYRIAPTPRSQINGRNRGLCQGRGPRTSRAQAVPCGRHYRGRTVAEKPVVTRAGKVSLISTQVIRHTAVRIYR